MSLDQVEAVVVGAGIAGASVAYEFASFGVETLVLEGAHGPAAGMSGANAGILHTGFWGTPQSFETSMLLAGGRRWPAIFDELKIPFKVCGAVLIAQDSSQLTRLGEVEKSAAEQGFKIKPYDRGQIRNLEPQAKAVGGLLVPGEAITDPYEMVSRLLATGANVRYSSPVESIEATDAGALVRCASGDVEARFVVNCAGLLADDIAKDDSFTLGAQRGDFVVFPDEAAILTDHVMYALPAADGAEQAVIFPTIYGTLGAYTSAAHADKKDWKSGPEAKAGVQASAAKLVPKLAGFEPTDAWVGLNSVGQPRDFIAEWSKRVPRMYNVAGLGSAGLTCALGLSAYVLDRCRERGLEVKSRSAPRARAQEPIFPWWQRRKR